MKSIKINMLLVAGTVAGLLYGSTAYSQGQPIQNIRDCARQLCYDLRNCNYGGGEVNYVEKIKAKKSGNQTQGFEEESCHQWALWSYYGCTEGGWGDVAKPIEPASKPKTTKTVKTTPKVD